MAQTKNVARCRGIDHDEPAFRSTVARQPAMRTGSSLISQRCGSTSFGENARTNVPRYIASGSTHSSGTAATSVEMWVVTPSIKLEGMNDRITHRSRLPAERGWDLTTSAAAESPGSSLAHARTAMAQAAVNATRTM